MTEAERERLAMLAEEAGEIVQIIGKILRHGYESYHPDDIERTTNRVLLQNELTDLWAVMYGMKQSGDILKHIPLPMDIEKAWQRKLNYSHYQGNK